MWTSLPWTHSRPLTPGHWKSVDRGVGVGRKSHEDPNTSRSSWSIYRRYAEILNEGAGLKGGEKQVLGHWVNKPVSAAHTIRSNNWKYLSTIHPKHLHAQGQPEQLFQIKAANDLGVLDAIAQMWKKVNLQATKKLGMSSRVTTDKTKPTQDTVEPASASTPLTASPLTAAHFQIPNSSCIGNN